jgi:hypothetical protein
MKKKL